MYENVSAEMVGATKGGAAVLADVRFGAGRHRPSIRIQHRLKGGVTELISELAPLIAHTRSKPKPVFRL